jgi:hypothetical protein
MTSDLHKRASRRVSTCAPLQDEDMRQEEAGARRRDRRVATESGDGKRWPTLSWHLKDGGSLTAAHI